VPTLVSASPNSTATKQRASLPATHYILEKPMYCARAFITALALAALPAITFPISAPAQTQSTTATDSKKLTTQKLKEMRAKWKANKPKLKACRAEVRKKGLIGDDRWFFIEECMDKA